MQSRFSTWHHLNYGKLRHAKRHKHKTECTVNNNNNNNRGSTSAGRVYEQEKILTEAGHESCPTQNISNSFDYTVDCDAVATVYDVMSYIQQSIDSTALMKVPIIVGSHAFGERAIEVSVRFWSVKTFKAEIMNLIGAAISIFGIYFMLISFCWGKFFGVDWSGLSILLQE